MRHRTRALALGLLGAALMVDAVCAADEFEDATLAKDYATCAAYYFSAVNARPMDEYEALYAAGEDAFNEAVSLVGRTAVDDLVATAAGEMTQITGANWLNFHRVDARYGAHCADMTGYGQENAEP